MVGGIELSSLEKLVTARDVGSFILFMVNSHMVEENLGTLEQKYHEAVNLCGYPFVIKEALRNMMASPAGLDKDTGELKPKARELIGKLAIDGYLDSFVQEIKAEVQAPQI